MKRFARLLAPSLLGLACLSGLNLAAQSPAALPSTNAPDPRVPALLHPGVTLEEVYKTLGKPEKYLDQNRKPLAKEALPATYNLFYPGRITVLVVRGQVLGIMCKNPGPGFLWKEKVHLGMPLEEVMKEFAPPTQTLQGQRFSNKTNVLYQDIAGEAGICAYFDAASGVELFFKRYKLDLLGVLFRPSQKQLDAMFESRLSPSNTLAIVRRPGAADFQRGILESLPAFDPNPTNQDPFQVDVRSADLRKLDLSSRLNDLLHADFDSRTRWPSNLPAEFVPQRLMELGKDPGLGVRQLHARGITGKGVSIGIIDQNLLVDHVEYKDRIRLYEEIHTMPSNSEMHGPAVASIAVGKSIGVAPEADLYYIGTFACDLQSEGRQGRDFLCQAQAIDRLLQINDLLPKEKKLRVISMSIGWSPNEKGFAEVNAAVERAKKAGVFVISSSLDHTHHLSFHGLGRNPLADPNQLSSYEPGSWWAYDFWQKPFATDKHLLVPMDSRCYASCTGTTNYEFSAQGGWSWSIPYLAGLYALACQVQPNITPEQFWAQALKTGNTIELTHAGNTVPFGTIANPVALIDSLQNHQ